MIYLDNSATTQPYKEVAEAYMKVATSFFGNPSSLHSLGMQAENLMIEARNRIAELLEVEAQEIIFTSGGTEGNSLAIKGTAYARGSHGKHVITSQVEHPSVLESFRQLEREGFEVTYLPVTEEGRVEPDDVSRALRPDTILVSLIHVNNEVGTIQPIEEIGKRLAGHPKVYYHVDHVQGITKVPLNVKASNVDLCTCSAHKFHGMKGTGFLYVRKGLQLTPLFQGGQQEGQIRAGTENVAGVVAMAKALRMSVEQQDQKLAKLVQQNKQVRAALHEIEGVYVNSPENCNAAPHIINFSVPGIKPEVLVQSLSAKQIYVSTKSACSSKLNAPSQILTAMGFGEDRASAGIRVSLSFETTDAEIATLNKELQTVIPELLEVIKREV